MVYIVDGEALLKIEARLGPHTREVPRLIQGNGNGTKH